MVESDVSDDGDLRSKHICQVALASDADLDDPGFELLTAKVFEE